MGKAVFWAVLLLIAFCVDRYGPAWLQALAVVLALVWFVVAAWWESLSRPPR